MCICHCCCKTIPLRGLVFFSPLAPPLTPLSTPSSLNGSTEHPDPETRQAARNVPKVSASEFHVWSSSWLACSCRLLRLFRAILPLQSVLLFAESLAITGHKRRLSNRREQCLGCMIQLQRLLSDPRSDTTPEGGSTCNATLTSCQPTPRLHAAHARYVGGARL